MRTMDDDEVSKTSVKDMKSLYEKRQKEKPEHSKSSKTSPGKAGIRVREFKELTSIRGNDYVTTKARTATEMKQRGCLPEWSAPRLFIGTNARTGQLELIGETEKALLKIAEPVVVVSVVGLYRTGKSFLLNRLSGQTQGFSLGATIESKTKGIWIWVLPHPLRDDCRLVLIDTEGLGDMNKKNADHDIWIFALGILLSGTFVYNSKGAIDQKAMNDIYYVTEVAKRVKIKSGSKESEEKELNKFFPSFIWAVRDFTLQLMINDKVVSDDEYLEYALTNEQNSDCEQKKGEKVHPKDAIKQYFHERKCFTFSLPVKDTDLMESIDTLREDQFNQKFLDKIEKFCSHIFGTSKVKTVFGNITTGLALAHLAKIYVEAIKGGAVPCIQSAVDTTAKLENEKAIKESLEMYKTKFEASIKFPTEREHLVKCDADCKELACNYFLKKSVFDDERVYYKKCVTEIQGIRDVLFEKNAKASEKFSNELLQKLSDKIFSKKNYMRAKGYQEYEKDMKELINQYNKTQNKGEMAEDVLKQFTKNLEYRRDMILQADSMLSDVEKKQKALENEKKLLEDEQKSRKKEQEREEKRRQDADADLRAHVKRLLDKEEEDRRVKQSSEETGAIDKIQAGLEAVLTLPAKAACGVMRWVAGLFSGK